MDNKNMRTIYELKQAQQDALSKLEWIDQDDQESLAEVQKIFNQIEGDVKRKLQFWITPLKEADGEVEIAEFQYKKFKEAHEANIKRKKKRAEWIREHITSLMVDFGINKFDDGLFKVSCRLTPGSLVKADTFDPELLPEDFVEVIPEHKEPKNKEIIAALRAAIEDKDNQRLISLPEFPGVILERKPMIGVR